MAQLAEEENAAVGKAAVAEVRTEVSLAVEPQDHGPFLAHPFVEFLPAGGSQGQLRIGDCGLQIGGAIARNSCLQSAICNPQSVSFTTSSNCS